MEHKVDTKIVSRPPFFLGIVAILDIITLLEIFLVYELLVTRIKRNYALFLIGIVTILSTIPMFYAFFEVLGDQAYFENQPASYVYIIPVQGLGNYSRNFELNESLKYGWFDFSMQLEKINLSIHKITRRG